MKPYGYKRFYHNRRFLYKHKGSGIIVDNIVKPAKALFSRAARGLTGTTFKTMAKKGIGAGVSKAGVSRL